MKRVISAVLCLIMFVSTAAFAAVDDLSATAGYLVNTVTDPSVASIGGEWTVIGLARSGADVPRGYFEKYYTNAENYVKSKNGVLHTRKYTEYARVTTALTAIGKDPENIGGYNIVLPLSDFESTIQQGINGAVWALIALDSGSYADSDVRGKYIAHILRCEKPGGGWALSDSDETADADVTAMALTALSKYQSDPSVKTATERALNVLSAMQSENGGYSSYGVQTAESAAQVLTALSALGIPYSDSRFVKNGYSLADNINSFRNSDGSFSHTDSSNLMATEQCFYALVSAKRVQEGKTALFDMSDVSVSDTDFVGVTGRNSDITAPKTVYPNKTFPDISGHKYETAVRELAERAVISGMSDGTFAPEKTLTRAEFTAIIVSALGLPAKSGGAFCDVAQGDWYYDFVNTAYAYGIISGTSDSEFSPNLSVTTEQTAVILEKTAILCGLTDTLDDTAVRDILAEFTDYTDVSVWARASVAFCFENNIADRSAMQINPKTAVKRGQAADMLYNLLKGAQLI